MTYVALFSAANILIGVIGPYSMTMRECEAFAAMKLFGNHDVAMYRCMQPKMSNHNPVIGSSKDQESLK